MKFLVVRLGSLGDLVHTLPAVAALRRAYPSATIDWLVEAPHRELLELVPVISSAIVLTRRTLRGWLEVRAQMLVRRYDIALDFQGLLKSAVLARLSGAATVMGFGRRALREPSARFFYTETVESTDPTHVIQKNLALAYAAGARPGPLEFPLSEVLSPALDQLRRLGVGRFALLNCGAAWPNKRWPAGSFGRIAAALRAEQALPSVVVWGPGEEPIARAVVDASDGAAIAAPPTGLRDLVALARAAELMVSGDTGPMHIAAAVGTPVVALFGPTDPARNGPWDPSDAVLSRYDRCRCHYQRICRQDATGWCLGTIDAADVQIAITERLGRGSALE